MTTRARKAAEIFVRVDADKSMIRASNTVLAPTSAGIQCLHNDIVIINTSIRAEEEASSSATVPELWYCINIETMLLSL